MAILNESKFGGRGKREIDISGPDGNAFALLGTASSFAKQLGWDKAAIDKMLGEMKSGDYENLLKVFDAHFGDIVDLVRYQDDDEDNSLEGYEEYFAEDED